MRRRLELLLLLSLAACGRDKEPSLAKVDSHAITEEAFRREIQGVPFAQSAYLQSNPGKKELLELLIRRQVVLSEAQKSGLAEKEPLKGRLADMESEFEKQRRDTRERLLVGEFLRDLKEKDLKVSEEEVRKAWGSEKEVKASHILVSDEAKAKDLKTRLDKGTPFESLAKEYSEDPTGKKGGDLGYLQKGSLVPEFENALFPLEVGRTTGPVSSPYGWHLIKKTGERPLSARPFEASEEALRSVLEKQKFQAWLDAARGRHKISTDTAALERFVPPAAPPASPQ
jgi:peptidyl-prolyl cis-trans isomerase C